MFGLNNDRSIQGLNAAGELLGGTNKLRVSPTIGPSREVLNASTQKLMAQLDHKIFKLVGMEIMKCVSHLAIWLANTPHIRDPQNYFGILHGDDLSINGRQLRKEQQSDVETPWNSCECMYLQKQQLSSETRPFSWLRFRPDWQPCSA